MRKLAFWAPYKSKDLKEHQSIKGHKKEIKNMFVGAIPGFVGTGISGYHLAKGIDTGNKKRQALALLGAFGSGMLAGTGANKAILKGDEAVGAVRNVPRGAKRAKNIETLRKAYIKKK